MKHQWYLRNKKHVREYQDSYKEEHPEKVRNYKLDWNRKNKDKKRASARKYYENNTEKMRHFHPVSRSSEYEGKDINERTNLGVAHGDRSKEKCNNIKKNKTLDEWFKFVEKEIKHES